MGRPKKKGRGRPVGSKNKTVDLTDLVHVRIVDGTPTFCKICDRAPFGRIVPLGFGKWRHDGCEAGSPEWCDYYIKLPKDQRDHDRDMLWAVKTGRI